jgi:hypothetical protein
MADAIEKLVRDDQLRKMMDEAGKARQRSISHSIA